MKRSELEHIIRAACAISGEPEIVVIGSQSVLGQYPAAPAALLASMEADVYPPHKPELSDLIDGAIGEGSQFHQQFGYYAQGVGPDTAILPRGWATRLIPVTNRNTGGFVGLCLEVHDLAISKYAAGRPKDLAFTGELARSGLTSHQVLISRLAATRVSPQMRRLIEGRVGVHFAKPRRRRPGRPRSR
jgi:hypothetical protein